MKTIFKIGIISILSLAFSSYCHAVVRPWTGQTDNAGDADGYYITGDMEIAGPITLTGNLKLIAYGPVTIKNTNKGSLFVVPGKNNNGKAVNWALTIKGADATNRITLNNNSTFITYTENTDPYLTEMQITLGSARGALPKNDNQKRTGPIIRCNGRLVLEHVTLTNNYNTTTGNNFNAGGIHIYGDTNQNPDGIDSSTLTDVKITKCHSSSGSAIRVHGKFIADKTVTIKNSEISYCSTDGDGGTIRTSGGLTANVTISNCTIHHCYSNDNGGAIWWNAASPGNLTIQNCEFHSNMAHNEGGAVLNAGNQFSMIGCNIHDNRATTGGGIYCRNYVGSGNNTGTLTLDSNCNIYQNNATYGGGVAIGLRQQTSGQPDVKLEMTLKVEGAKIYGNTAQYGGGISMIRDAGLSAVYKGFFEMSSGYIYGNTAIAQGGGVYLAGGITNTMNGGFIGSDAFGNARGNTSTGNGGGVYVDGGTSSISAISIVNNSSSNGNAGGMFVNNGSVAIKSGLIRSNKALMANGGGAFINGGDVTLEQGNIEYNSAKNGGGIFLASGASMTFKGGIISNNNALATDTATATTAYHGAPGSVIEGFGGGIYLQTGPDGDHKTSLVFNLPVGSRTFGLYNNVASKGGAEIVSEGGNTNVELPSVANLELVGFEGVDANPNWYQDYLKNDSQYNNVADETDHHAVNHIVSNVDRYENIINSPVIGEYMEHLISEDRLLPSPSVIRANYLCVTLGFNMLKITVIANGLLGNETALFKLIRHGLNSDKTYEVLLVKNAEGVASRSFVSMPWGTYSVVPDDDWNWAYEPVAAKDNVRIGDVGHYEFVFDMSHRSGALIPQHEEVRPTL